MMVSLSKYDVPDAVFPTNNDFGIPVLRMDRMADFVDCPVLKWGTIARSTPHGGTYHFYTDDYKFTGIWRSPERLLNSGSPSVIEVNYSTNDMMPKALVIAMTYKKRWLSRYWQEKGVRVFVDLGVSIEHAETNLIGVPDGWRAFATRVYMKDDPHGYMLESHWNVAKRVRGNDDILFCVYGGNHIIREKCIEMGWVWLPEQSLEARMLAEDPHIVR